MSFPIESKYIRELETELNVKFPPKFIKRMMVSNGGEVETEELDILLYPFYDKTDKKRISRTCNHIGRETKSAKEWTAFPTNGVAIGTDGFGNQLILLHEGNGLLKETIYFWDHETGEMEEFAPSIFGNGRKIMNSKSISVAEALSLLKAGNKIEEFTIDFKGAEVKALDAFNLGKAGIQVPDEVIVYDDADVAYDPEFDNYEWSERILIRSKV
ncbi:MAG: SMI1/KNR4 family protein [Saprospirales bacterium]|nr:SMI1/KNR4 family protein [Saprospirales bacterium]